MLRVHQSLCFAQLKSTARCWSLFALLVISGCQGESKGPPAGGAGAAPAAIPAATPVAKSAEGTAPEAALTLAAPESGPEAPAKGSAENPPSAVTEKPAAVAPTPKWVKPQANPSPEQLKAWAIPNDPPLQLLACHDFDDFFVQDLAITPDGKRFVLAGSKLTLWTVGKGEPEVDLIAKLTDEADVERPLLSVGISPDGEWLAAGDKRGKLRVWKLSDQSEAYVILAHEGRLTELAISPDSKTIATTSYAGEVRTWQLADGKQLKRLKVDKQEIESLVFVSPTRLATAGREIGLWDTESGEKVTSVSTDRVSNPVLGLLRDGQRLVYPDENGRAQGWDIASGKGIGLVLGGLGNGLIDESSDGTRIAAYAGEATIRLCSAATGSTTQVLDADGDRTVGLQWVPGTGALLVASQTGRVRLWGTAEMATTLAITPPASPQLREPASATKRSDTPARFDQVIDLRSFPRLPNALAGSGYGGMETYSAPTTQPDAELFYRFHLGEAGWLEAATPDPTSPGLNFQKEGYALNVSFAPPFTPVPGREKDLQINLRFAGNYDARWLPRIAPVEGPGTFATMSLLMYRTKSDLMELEVALLKQLREGGWTPFSRLTSSHAEEPDSRMLTFLQGGSELNLSLGHPSDTKSEVMVQASVSLTRKSLPLPPDSSWIEFDASTQLRVLANTAMTLQETIAFFNTEMPLDGWLPREMGRIVDEQEKRAFLPYIRGQQDVLLRLATLPDGRTRILVGEAEGTSWQVKNETPESPDKSAKTQPGIEAADFELPKGASAVKFNVDEKQIEFDLPDVPPTKLGEQFAKQMEALGWERDGAGILGDDYTFITFKSGKAELELRARGQGKSSSVMLGGDGLLWTKPLPALPVRVSYETWLRRGGKPATLELLDTFAEEMRKIPTTQPDKK
jgi:hypothetical protein